MIHIDASVFSVHETACGKPRGYDEEVSWDELMATCPKCIEAQMRTLEDKSSHLDRRRMNLSKRLRALLHEPEPKGDE